MQRPCCLRRRSGHSRSRSCITRSSSAHSSSRSSFQKFQYCLREARLTDASAACALRARDGGGDGPEGIAGRAAVAARSARRL